MIHGLDVFRDWFAEYPNRYVIIGATASNLVLAKYGAPDGSNSSQTTKQQASPFIATR